MKYVSAAEVLPDRLIAEIQKYVQGETIYIPKHEAAYKKWGTRSGSRRLLDERNTSIRTAFRAGTPINELASKHCLSIETIKKIVYTKIQENTDDLD